MSVLGSAILLWMAATTDGPSASGPVVFVCAHGNVKSLIASEWLNRLAAERGMSVRAIARGLTPENPVPPPIVERLRQDGFDVAGYQARSLAPEDVRGAARVVFIGVEPPPWTSEAAVESWTAIPPASEAYAESRDAMRARIETLLRQLEARPAP